MVHGEYGTCRFEGFLWGYMGEGPRGLVQLLLKCGIKQQHAEFLAFDSGRGSDIGTDWIMYPCSNGGSVVYLPS